MYRLNVEEQNRCIETIAPRDDWLVLIGHRYINLNYLREEDDLHRRSLESSHFYTGKLIFPAPQALERSLYSIIEENPLKYYNYIETKSIETQVLVPRMALHLSARSIETICDKIFSKKGINEQFVELFYQNFFSTYLKRIYSWSSLHMLIKASKAYPVHFRTTLNVLFNDLNIPNKIMQDYVETLNEKSCTKLIKFVSQIQLKPQEFIHNIPVIYLLYKKCTKNEEIFQFIQSNLGLYNFHCTYNKDYGRLLLYFVQNLSGFDVRIRLIKKMIENHGTIFKSPCMATLRNFVIEILALQMNFPEGPRIVIPKLPEGGHQL